MLKKKEYLLNKYIERLRGLNPDTLPQWGKMNPFQMVEHMAYSFQLANGKIIVEDLFTPIENIAKIQLWILSSRPMKENIQNPLIPETPPIPKNADYDMAIDELVNEMKDMFNFYDQNPHIKLLNPFFGELDIELNTNLLYKHAIHHLRQFGITEEYIED